MQGQRPGGQSLSGVFADQPGAQVGGVERLKVRVVGGQVGEDWMVHFVSR